MDRTIVLALDGSGGSDRAIPVAVDYARHDGARVVVAHARTHAIEPSIEAKLRSQVDGLVAAGIEATSVTKDSLTGREADVIAEVARSHRADMIVIASRGRGPVAGALLGSTTLRLVPIAPCPVVVVPMAHVEAGVRSAGASAVAP